MSRILFSARLVLILLSAIGFYLVWFLVYLNGTVSSLQAIQKNYDAPVLPGTNVAPLLRRYTDIKALDRRLVTLCLIFWEQIDGSRPQSSLHLFYFAGQILAAWPILMHECSKPNIQWRIVSFLTLWGLAIQSVSYAVVTPVFLAFHLSTVVPMYLKKSGIDHQYLTSSLHYDLDLENIRVKAIWPSVLFGYAIPALAMALPAPSIISYESKQRCLAIWQFFPLWTGLLHQIFVSVLSKYHSSMPHTSRKGAHEAQLRFHHACFMAASITHLSSLFVIASSTMFPMLYPISCRDILTFSKVLVPATPRPIRMPSIGDGGHLLFQWDQIIGSTSIACWSFTQYDIICMAKGTRQSSRRTLGLWRAIALFAVSGPIGLAISFLIKRDEMICECVDDDYPEIPEMKKAN